MNQNCRRLLRFASLALLAGTYFAIGPCDVAQYVAQINPCGTILNCDPAEYRYVQAGYEGPGADPDVDPFCTWPPFCDPQVDPLQPTGTATP